MKARYFIFSLIFLVNFSLLGQNYSHVDKKVQSYPKSFSNIDKLANQINKDFKKPDEKARAIYTWVALHIEYDVKGMASSNQKISYSYRTQEEKLQKEKQMEEDLANKTLKKKLAVCEGYSTLYKLLCDKTSLECVIIHGTSKTREQDIGKEPGKQTDHAWNAVKIDGKWKLLDATWGAGYVDVKTGKFKKNYTDFYFFTNPDLFFLKHYPEDKKWMLTSKTAKDFADAPLYYRDYFVGKIKIIEPTKGVIKASKNKAIKVVMQNVTNQQVIFSIGNSNRAQQVTPKKKGDLSTYEIETKSAGYLIIFVDGEAFASFKIERK